MDTGRYPEKPHGFFVIRKIPASALNKILRYGRVKPTRNVEEAL
jgi:hypothetical protein